MNINIGLHSVLLLQNGKLMQQSTAVLHILRGLAWPWPLFVILLILPRFLRDALYNLFARFRYRLFGKKDFCELPPAHLQDRFLD